MEKDRTVWWRRGVKGGALVDRCRWREKSREAEVGMVTTVAKHIVSTLRLTNSKIVACRCERAYWGW